jgi:hypothetical protein
MDLCGVNRCFCPRGVNLFDFTLADLDNDGLIEKIAITRDLKLVVYRQQQ